MLPVGQLPDEKNSSSGCGTYVQYLAAAGICMVFVPVFVAWIWCHHHNKGTLESTHSVDRRPSTGSSPLLPISLARSGLGSKLKRNRERRQSFGQCYTVGWVIGSNPDNMAPLCRSSNSLVKPPPPHTHPHTVSTHHPHLIITFHKY